MNREELIERICPTDASDDCAKGKHGMSCDKCDELLNKWLDDYDAKIRADSVKEFAEWLSNTEYVASQGHFILPLKGSYSVDELLDMWEKEQNDGIS